MTERPVTRRKAVLGITAAAAALARPSILRAQASGRVVVVGGGFGGAACARALKRARDDLHIILIEPNAVFTSCPFSNAVIAGLREIEAQQFELLRATDEADLRRRFSEAVLSGVSRGVIGLDSELRINLPNPRANKLVDFKLEKHIGTRLTELFPVFGDLLARAKMEPTSLHHAP